MMRPTKGDMLNGGAPVGPGTPAPDVVVLTPDMIDAGVQALAAATSATDHLKVQYVFIAMMGKR